MSFTIYVRGGACIDETWGDAGHDNPSRETAHGRAGKDLLRATRVAHGGPGREQCSVPVRVGWER
jgi:hypothetical protein